MNDLRRQLAELDRLLAFDSYMKVFVPPPRERKVEPKSPAVLVARIARAAERRAGR